MPRKTLTSGRAKNEARSEGSLARSLLDANARAHATPASPARERRTTLEQLQGGGQTSAAGRRRRPAPASRGAKKAFSPSNQPDKERDRPRFAAYLTDCIRASKEGLRFAHAEMPNCGGQKGGKGKEKGWSLFKSPPHSSHSTAAAAAVRATEIALAGFARFASLAALRAETTAAAADETETPTERIATQKEGPTFSRRRRSI